MTGPADYDLERREILTAAGRTVWHLAGEGLPLLLVHGGAGSWTHWRRAIPELAPARRLLMPDLPGFGGSDLPSGPPDPAVLASAVREGVEALVDPEARLPIVGFSFGALVCGLLAEGIADRVERLVIVGPSGLGLPTSRRLPLRRWHGLEPPAREAVHRHNLATLMLADTAAIDGETVALRRCCATRA